MVSVPDIIHSTEPNDNQRYRSREFAEPPGTVNVKCFPGHVELNWHTNAEVADLFEILDDPSVHTNVSVEVSGSGIDEIDDEMVSLHRFQNLTDPSMINPKRGQFSFTPITVVWAGRSEPLHETLLKENNREPLKYHLSFSGPPGRGITTEWFERLYLQTGEPAINESKRQNLIDSINKFISKSEEEL